MIYRASWPRLDRFGVLRLNDAPYRRRADRAIECDEPGNFVANYNLGIASVSLEDLAMELLVERGVESQPGTSRHVMRQGIRSLY
jgi:hypothetical protein